MQQDGSGCCTHSSRYTEETKETTMRIYPLGKRVLLVKDVAPSESKGGIYIPDGSREQPLVAHVRAIGDEVSRVARGDEVVYASFAGTTFQIGGDAVIVVDEDDIMLVLQEEPELPDVEDVVKEIKGDN